MVAVVNESFVRRYWPDRDPLGLTVKNGGARVDDEGAFEVVGVIADIRTTPGEAPPPKIYVPYEFESAARMNVILETTGPTDGPIAALRAAVSELDPGLPVARVATLEGVVVGVEVYLARTGKVKIR